MPPRLSILAVAVLIFVLGHVQPLRAQPKSAGDWPVFRGNASQTGVADSDLPDKLAVRWSFKGQASIESSPIIAGATVFVATTNGKLYALDLASGMKKWEYDAGPLKATPAARNGTVYVGDLKGNFHAVDAVSGKKRWMLSVDADIHGPANFARDNILFGSDDHHLYCVSAKGEIVWQCETKEKIRSGPAVHGDHVFVAGCDQALHIIEIATGKEVNAVPLGGHVGASVALAGGHVYVGNMANQFLAVDWNKKNVLWQFEARKGAQPFYSSAAVTDDLVIAGSRDKNIRAWKRGAGVPAWEFPTKGRVDSSPVVAGKRVIVGSLDGHLYVLDLARGSEIARFDLGSIASSPAVGGQCVVVATFQGDVYCLAAKK